MVKPRTPLISNASHTRRDGLGHDERDDRPPPVLEDERGRQPEEHQAGDL